MDIARFEFPHDREFTEDDYPDEWGEDQKDFFRRFYKAAYYHPAGMVGATSRLSELPMTEENWHVLCYNFAHLGVQVGLKRGIQFIDDEGGWIYVV